MKKFIGHAIYEKRKPALVDSLDQALITAPMFVLLEILFHAGYKPDLYDRVLRRASKNTHQQTANECARRETGARDDACSSWLQAVADE